MRTYSIRLSSNLRSKVEVRTRENVLDLIKSVKRGRWLKDTDGEYINPLHVVSIRLAGKS